MLDINIVAEEKEHFYYLKIEGRFNFNNAMKVRRRAEQAINSKKKVLCIDLSKTTLMDTNGIRLLITLHKESAAKECKIHIVSSASPITKLLQKCGIHKVITLHPNMKEFKHILISGELSKEERGFYILFKLPKEFDLHVVKPLRDAIDMYLAEGHTNMVFDLEKTVHITSVGIGVLMNLHKTLQSKDGSVYLVAIPEKIRTLLEDTNVLKVLKEFETISQVDEKFI